MFTYTFFGKVLPERTFVTLGPIPKMKIQTILPDGNMDYEAQVVIDTAQIMVVAHSPISIADLETLRNSVEKVVRGIVDAFGYIEGRGYDVELTSAIDSAGDRWQIFPIEIGAIQATKNERPLPFGELCGLLIAGAGVLGNDAGFKLSQLRIALGDLREAIRSIDHSAFFCYRAIECLRQCYLELNSPISDATRKDSWERMREELCIGRSWIDDIETASIPERHGGHEGTKAEGRNALMIRTWRVIDRFVMSAQMGFNPLSERMLEWPEN